MIIISVYTDQKRFLFPVASVALVMKFPLMNIVCETVKTVQLRSIMLVRPTFWKVTCNVASSPRYMNCNRR